MKKKYRITLDIEIDLDDLSPFKEWNWSDFFGLKEGAVSLRAARVLEDHKADESKKVIRDFIVGSSSAAGIHLVDKMRKLENEITYWDGARRAWEPTKTELIGEQMTAREKADHRKNPADEKLKELGEQYAATRERVFEIGAQMRKAKQ